MALERTEGLILRTIKYGETSKIVTLLTRDFGLVKAMAKGVRGAKPKFGAALESFARSEIILYRKRDRDLHLIGQADLLEPYLPLSADVKRYAFATAVVEFVQQVLPGEAEAGAAALYDEAVTALELIAASAIETLPYLLRAFQLRFISHLGHAPELHACLNCGREVDEGARLSALQGGLHCAACARDLSGGAVPVSKPALAVLQAYVENPLVVAARQRLTPAVRAEVGRVMEAFLTAQFDNYRGLRAMKLAAAVL